MLPIIVKMKAVRAAHGLSQADVAKALGVSRLSVANWENGRGSPRQKVRERIEEWNAGQHGPVNPQVSAWVKENGQLRADLQDYVRHVHLYHEVVTHAIEALQQYNKVAAHQISEETTRIMGLSPVKSPVVLQSHPTKETGADNPFL